MHASLRKQLEGIRLFLPRQREKMLLYALLEDLDKKLPLDNNLKEDSVLPGPDLLLLLQSSFFDSCLSVLILFLSFYLSLYLSFITSVDNSIFFLDTHGASITPARKISRLIPSTLKISKQPLVQHTSEYWRKSFVTMGCHLTPNLISPNCFPCWRSI